MLSARARHTRIKRSMPSVLKRSAGRQHSLTPEAEKSSTGRILSEPSIALIPCSTPKRKLRGQPGQKSSRRTGCVMRPRRASASVQARSSRANLSLPSRFNSFVLRREALDCKEAIEEGAGRAQATPFPVRGKSPNNKAPNRNKSKQVESACDTSLINASASGPLTSLANNLHVSSLVANQFAQAPERRNSKALLQTIATHNVQWYIRHQSV